MAKTGGRISGVSPKWSAIAFHRIQLEELSERLTTLAKAGGITLGDAPATIKFQRTISLKND
ncbi:hypothetical protein [Trichocoleus sp. FACHB-40]|uniref:hypothetical protein n=2 Tax=Cyanophyceae TaxID=3028117 RepID=UPI0016830FBA|nr:hypothetical protein [Trichocoleus sp. FACHB-40]